MQADVLHRLDDRRRAVRVVQVEVEDADRPHAGLAQGLYRGGGGVEVAVAGEPGGSGVVAGRAAERVGEAGAAGEALAPR